MWAAPLTACSSGARVPPDQLSGSPSSCLKGSFHSGKPYVHPSHLCVMEGSLPQAELFSAIPLIQGVAKLNPELQLCLWESAGLYAQGMGSGYCEVLGLGAASSQPCRRLVETKAMTQHQWTSTAWICCQVTDSSQCPPLRPTPPHTWWLLVSSCMGPKAPGTELLCSGTSPNTSPLSETAKEVLSILSPLHLEESESSKSRNIHLILDKKWSA